MELLVKLRCRAQTFVRASAGVVDDVRLPTTSRGPVELILPLTCDHDFFMLRSFR